LLAISLPVDSYSVTAEGKVKPAVGAIGEARSTNCIMEQRARFDTSRRLAAGIGHFVRLSTHWAPELREKLSRVVQACSVLRAQSLAQSSSARAEREHKGTFGQDGSPIQNSSIHSEYICSLQYMRPYAKGGFGRVMLARQPANEMAEFSSEVRTASTDAQVRVAKAIDMQALRDRGSNMLQRCCQVRMQASVNVARPRREIVIDSKRDYYCVNLLIPFPYCAQEPMLAALASIDGSPFVA